MSARSRSALLLALACLAAVSQAGAAWAQAGQADPPRRVRQAALPAQPDARPPAPPPAGVSVAQPPAPAPQPRVITVPQAAPAAAPTATVSSQQAAPLMLTKGTQRALSFGEAVTRIIVADGTVTDASVLNERQVQLTALRTGRTGVTIYTGPNAVPATFAVTVVPDLGAMQTLLTRDPALRGVSVTADGDRVIAGGTVGSPAAHARAIDALRAYYGEQVIDMMQVGGAQMIAVEVRFAAVQADTLKEIGFNFSSGGHGFAFATAGPNTGSGFSLSRSALTVPGALPLGDAFNLFLASPASNLLAVLSALSDASIAAILAEPTLMVRAGDQANFVAGGEIPIPVPQGGASGGAITVEYHEYGVKLAIAPTVLADGRIAMTIAPEVSEVDTANTLTVSGYTVPAFRKRSTTTTIELRDGETFVLAGLIYSSANVNESKVPGLGDLPIIGSFFRYARNAREKQELIIVATPHIVQPLPAGQVPPLPGQELIGRYDPGIGSFLLNRAPVSGAMAQYGLMP
jgi:pilus assembly protein CpaC